MRVNRGCEGVERGAKNRVAVEPELQLLGDRVLGGFLERDLLPGFLECDGFVKVVAQGSLQRRDLFEGGELDPASGLRMFSRLFEDVLRVLEQRTFEEREGTRLLERDDDGYVLFRKGEAGFAPLEFFGEVAIEGNLAKLVCFLLPLCRVGNFHGLSLRRRC